MKSDTTLSVCGPLRSPKQMLEDQEYDGHTSIHDDETAEKLGFKAGPIEGPTHFSQLAPLLYELFGQAFFERGCISAHYQNMVVEGEQVRAFATAHSGGQSADVWLEKADGTPVLEASASLGPEHGPTLLEQRMAKLRPPGPLVILEDLTVGMQGAADEKVRMDPDQHMGKLYPFSLNQKLERITEGSPWYSDPSSTPWGKAIIPLEMISVLAEYSSHNAKFPVKGPAVGLFADQEIRLIKGPLFVGEDYLIRREIAALSESRRTESYWVRTKIFDSAGHELLAEMLLNHASLKHSYANYDARLAALG
ncbi:MAG: hypothetical protein ACPH4G_09660 [Henriciella sp.]